MGMGQEMLDDMECQFYAAENFHEDRAEAGIWRMKDNTDIKMRDMSSSHVKNTIAMLERGNWPFADVYIDALGRELAKRSVM